MTTSSFFSARKGGARNRFSDPMSGQFNDPIRLVAFNTLEHWSEDRSDIAFEIETRCDIKGVAVAEHIQDVVGSHTGSDHQLTLRLA